MKLFLLLVFSVFFHPACSPGVFVGKKTFDNIVPIPPLLLLWTYSMDGPAIGQALGVEGVVYQATTSGSLYALDNKTGERIGKKKFREQISAPLALSNAWFGLPVQEKDFGMLIWNRETQSRYWNGLDSGCLTPVFVGDVIIVGNEHGKVIAFDLVLNEELWSNDLEGTLRVRPGYFENALYVGSSNGTLSHFSVETGKSDWTVQLDSAVRSIPLGDRIGLFVGTANGKVYLLDIKDGEVKWESSISGVPTESLSLDNDILVVGTSDRKLYGIEVDSGNIRWDYETEGVVKGSPVAKGGIVYAPSSDEQIYAIEVESGKLLWKFRLDGPALQPLALLDGTIIVATERKTLYAFGNR